MKQRGFTLVELLVVLVLLAILASLAVPSFTKIIAQRQVKTTADKLRSTLIFARQEALKRNRSVSITAANQAITVSAPAIGASAAETFQTWAYSLEINSGTATSVTLSGNGRASVDSVFLVKDARYACSEVYCYQAEITTGGAVKVVEVKS